MSAKRKKAGTKPPRLDVFKIVRLIQSPPFNFTFQRFEVIGGDDPVFSVSFDAVDPCARHELEHVLEAKGFDVHGGGTEMGPKGCSDISFSFKKRGR